MKKKLTQFREFIKSLYHKKVRVSGVGITNNLMNVFYTFEYDYSGSYNLRQLQKEATNRYNLKKCTILHIMDINQISISLIPKKLTSTGSNNVDILIKQPLTSNPEVIDQIQYLQLT